jgi:hypothetical protein
MREETTMPAIQNRTYSRLAALHPDRYREIYLEEKGTGTGSDDNGRARGRALVRLAKEKRDDYLRLYREEKERQ